jgi:hypothetical protein
MTIYGSSHIRNVNYIGVTGPTGNTGATGNFGLGGAIGRTGPTGNTGANISGMTLNSSGNIVTIFDDNTTAIGPVIDAPDGAYYLFADGENIAGDGYSAFYGLTYEGQGTVPVLQFRGITTGSFNQELQIVGISSSSQSEDITVRYSITNLSYIGICGGTQGQLIIQKVGNYFYGLTGTFYDKANQTVDLQVQNYGERVKFVRPTIKDFIDSEGGESAAPQGEEEKDLNDEIQSKIGETQELIGDLKKDETKYDSSFIKTTINSLLGYWGDALKKLDSDDIKDIKDRLEGSQVNSDDTEKEAPVEEVPAEEPSTEKLDENLLRQLKFESKKLLKEQLKQEIEKRKRSILIESIKNKLK